MGMNGNSVLNNVWPLHVSCLENTPSIFQVFMNDGFILNQFVIVYIDEVLVYSKIFTEHTVHVRQVLSQTETDFYQSDISFLGYSVGPAGVSMEMTVNAVTGAETLQRFGLLGASAQWPAAF